MAHLISLFFQTASVLPALLAAKRSAGVALNVNQRIAHVAKHESEGSTLALKPTEVPVSPQKLLQEFLAFQVDEKL